MAEKTDIQWCDSTFNAWEGCTKISPGCDNCYAETRNNRFHSGENWGVGAPRLLRSDAYWREPVKWNAGHLEFFAKNGHRQRVFCSSLADVFDVDAPEGQRERLWALIKATPNLDWLILTKRIGNAKKMLPDDWCNGYPNVWLMITVVNQEEADRDIPKLLDIPAAIRGLSMEPLIGPVDLKWHLIEPSGNFRARGNKRQMEFICHNKLHWAIVGGESGSMARPMHPQWVSEIRDQCKAADVPFHFKQWGEWCPRSSCYHTLTNGMAAADMDMSATQWTSIRLTYNGNNGRDLANVNDSNYGDDVYMQKVGIKLSGTFFDGSEHRNFPLRKISA